MSGIASMIEGLLLTVISQRVLTPRKSRMDWVLMALSILLAGSGLFFLGLALERYLETLYQPDQAALAAGLLMIISAFLVSAAAWRLHRKKATHNLLGHAELGKSIQTLVQSLCSELEEPVRENPKAAILVAAVTGFIAANFKR
jgi:hypothetical protein